MKTIKLTSIIIVVFGLAAPTFGMEQAVALNGRRPVAGDPRQHALLRPAAIAVHDDGDVAGDIVGAGRLFCGKCARIFGLRGVRTCC